MLHICILPKLAAAILVETYYEVHQQTTPAECT
jgi:hypothetical protein